VQGHEFGGLVTSIGRSARVAFSVGDRVAVEPIRACGSCLPCRRGRANCCARLEVMGAHIHGALAERVAVPGATCYPVGDLDATLTALVEPVSIGLHAVARAGVVMGDRILVMGAGPIGLAIVLAAIDRGARVMVADRVTSRLALASAFGAELAVNVEDESVADRVGSWTHGEGPTCVIEATGVPSVVRLAIDLVAASGSVVIVGLSDQEVGIPLIDMTRKELAIVGSRNNAGLFGDAVNLVRRRRDDVRRLVTHRFPLARVADAMSLAAANDGTVAKILIDIEPPGGLP
jgi:L-gulonate 5-dehydrogenase